MDVHHGGRACPCTIFDPATDEARGARRGAATGRSSSASGSAPIEDGYITSLRFYKQAQQHRHARRAPVEPGRHAARDATFTGETASGWQRSPCRTRSRSRKDTTYVASYYAAGRLLRRSTSGYFDQRARTAAPLHALATAPTAATASTATAPARSRPTRSTRTNYWVDVVVRPHGAARHARAGGHRHRARRNGAATSRRDTDVTATFDEPIAPASRHRVDVHADRSPAAPCPGHRHLQRARRARQRCTPTAPLAYQTTYTATLKGGDRRHHGRRRQPAGPDKTWTFTTTAPPPPPPDEGPGGPILVVTDAARPVRRRYYAEILRAEGLNEFDVTRRSHVTAATLTGHDVVDPRRDAR